MKNKPKLFSCVCTNKNIQYVVKINPLTFLLDSDVALRCSTSTTNTTNKLFHVCFIDNAIAALAVHDYEILTWIKLNL